MNDVATLSETISSALTRLVVSRSTTDGRHRDFANTQRPGFQRKASLLLWNWVHQGRKRLPTFRRDCPGIDCTSGLHHAVIAEQVA
jgi:hypothetical protein